MKQIYSINFHVYPEGSSLGVKSNITTKLKIMAGQYIILHTYIRTYIHTYIHTCMHSWMQCIYAYIQILAYIRFISTYTLYTQIHIQKLINTYTHTYSYKYIHTHKYIDTYAYTYINTYTHTYTFTHSHIHTCTHTAIHTYSHIRAYTR